MREKSFISNIVAAWVTATAIAAGLRSFLEDIPSLTGNLLPVTERKIIFF
jgi:hypothetical protein